LVVLGGEEGGEADILQAAGEVDDDIVARQTLVEQPFDRSGCGPSAALEVARVDAFGVDHHAFALLEVLDLVEVLDLSGEQEADELGAQAIDDQVSDGAGPDSAQPDREQDATTGVAKIRLAPVATSPPRPSRA
jgi:hypothetical protein